MYKMHHHAARDITAACEYDFRYMLIHELEFLLAQVKRTGSDAAADQTIALVMCIESNRKPHAASIPLRQAKAPTEVLLS